MDKEDRYSAPTTLAAPTVPDAMESRALGIVAFTTVLALLYVGRGVLVPFTVALILSLLIAPLVRRLRRLGLGQTSAVLVVVLSLALALSAAAGLLATQVLRVAAGLPHYQLTIQEKLRYLDEITVGRLDLLTSEASRLLESHPRGASSSARETADLPPPRAPMPVELRQPRPSSLQVIRRVVGSVWSPVASTGIVLVVLVFVLLEHEAVRDRFIRAVGGANIRVTTVVLNDAGERLSGFFLSQFAVNLGVGVAIALGLAFLDVPQAFLWGSLATLLRFVPYIGVWLAAFSATALAIAVAPGWSLALSTLGLFVTVELIAGQAVEPNLYGHTTGLSPLSVVVSAIFWSTIWGPIGLVLSTPLTLCLLVLGRHVRALSFLDLMLGDAQALTLAQRLYQRALSGDTDEILGFARTFLKHNSFAAYCDSVLMPALHIAFLDWEAGLISQEQQSKMRDILVAVVSSLSDKPRRVRPRSSVLEEQNAGLILRKYREQLTGRWQGPLAVLPGSILLCLGLGSRVDTIAAELLVRALREQDLDARHVTITDLDAGPPPGANPAGIGAVYLVSAFPSPEREQSDATIDRVRQRMPSVRVISVFLPGILISSDLASHRATCNGVVDSFVQAVRACVQRQTEPA